MTKRPQPCAGCATNPNAAPGRACAPNRCYCGHPECPAFDSYREHRGTLATVTPITRKARPSSWADREEPTWIDKL